MSCAGGLFLFDWLIGLKASTVDCLISLFVFPSKFILWVVALFPQS